MRRHREDFAGADWHIWNGGIAKRAVFETAQDVERFSGALDEVVDEGLLVVHAFVFMTTHYHLLAASPKDEISEAMKLVGNAFVRCVMIRAWLRISDTAASSGGRSAGAAGVEVVVGDVVLRLALASTRRCWCAQN